MSVEIGIYKIKEDEFVFRNEDIGKIDKEKLSIGFNLSFDWNLDEERFFIKLIIFYTYEFDNSKIELVKFSSTTGFSVKNLKDILKLKANSFELPDFFMMTFVSVTVSNGRGMLAYKLAGTFLSDFYLPLVDPKDFLNQIDLKAKKEAPKRVVKKLSNKKLN